MRYYTLPPPPPLAHYVRFFWVFECDSLPEEQYIYRSMADGCAELIFHYKGVFDELEGSAAVSSARAHLHAQTRRHRRFVTNQPFGIFGVYLYPYALPYLLDLPAGVLSDYMPGLDDLLGPEGPLLEEQVLSATDHTQRVACVSAFLLKRLAAKRQSPDPVAGLIRGLICNERTVPVTELARECFLSVRQFERNFKTYAGFSPKLYARILRFQQVLRRYGHEQESLTALSHQYGYYDQSHFIRDFQEFSGYNPRTYFRGAAEGTEYRDA